MYDIQRLLALVDRVFKKRLKAADKYRDDPLRFNDLVWHEAEIIQKYREAYRRSRE